MKQVTHIIFDLGNTLVYFEGDWEWVFHKALIACASELERLGLYIEPKEFQARFGATLRRHYEQREIDLVEHSTDHLLRRTIAEMGLPFTPDSLIDAGLESFYRVTQASWIPEPGALGLLRELSGRGYRLGVISNAAYDPDPQMQVDDAGFRPYVDFVLTSAGYGRRKPHPGIFRHALGLWQVAADQAAMVGDTLAADIRGANQAGMHSIWVTRHAGAATEAAVQEAGPEAVIERLGDLRQLLEV